MNTSIKLNGLTFSEKNVTNQLQILTLENRSQLLNQLNQVCLPQQKTLCTQIFNNPFRKRRDYFSLSPFVVQKTILSFAGEPKSLSNDLLIHRAKKSHEKVFYR